MKSSRRSLPFLEIDVLCTELCESSLHHPFYYYASIYAYDFEVASSLQVFQISLCTFLFLAMRATCAINPFLLYLSLSHYIFKSKQLIIKYSFLQPSLLSKPVGSNILFRGMFLMQSIHVLLLTEDKKFLPTKTIQN